MLSDRVRANIEAAPWVIEEIKQLEKDKAGLITATEMANKAIISLMGEVVGQSVTDLGLVNNALCEISAVLKKAKGV